MNFLWFLLAVYGVCALVYRSALITELLDFIYAIRLRERYKPRTADLYSEPLSVIAHEDTPHVDHFLQPHHKAFRERHKGHLPTEKVQMEIGRAAVTLYGQEVFIKPVVPSQNVLIAAGGYRDQVQESLNRRKNVALNLPTFERCLHASWDAYMRLLPADAFDRREPFAEIPLLDALPDGGDFINRVVNPIIAQEHRSLGLFTEFIHRYEQNLHSASGASYPTAARRIIYPQDFKGTATDAADAYLGGTALRDLFEVQIPFNFVEKLGEHCLLLAPPGWGKTQFIQSLARYLLAEPEAPSIIILNSQGGMLDRIQKLSIFAPGEQLSDRLVIIDPEDEYPPALNMFALPTERTSKYQRNIREQVEAGTLQTFKYLFESFNSALTGKQTTIFYPLVKLMLSMKGATFNTLIDVLAETISVPKGTPDQDLWRRSAWADNFEKLDTYEREFFQKEFFTRHYANTRQELTQRIRHVLGHEAFRRMFAAVENKFDLFTLINRGSVILVNTSKSLLGNEGSAFFGRWFLSLLIRAAYERVAIKNPRRTLLIIDEASDYVDDSFDEILSKLRQFNVGCLMAFQSTKQIANFGSVVQNTAVKLVGGVEDFDATSMSRSMRVTPQWLMSMRRTQNDTEFAAYVRGKTEAAVRLRIPYFHANEPPEMTQIEHDRLRSLNRERYSSAPQLPKPTPPNGPTLNQRPPELEKWRLDKGKDGSDDTTHSKPSKDW